MGDVFEQRSDGAWVPSEYARGPFAGLQDGAVAGLLVAELEREAERSDLGTALSASIQFLRPAPLAPLRTAFQSLRTGRRVSTLRNELRHEDALLAVATVTFAHASETAEVSVPDHLTHDPARFGAAPERANPHEGGPWFMDTFDVRSGAEGIRWFGITRPLVTPAMPLAKVLGPADWAHGIGRPLQPKLADPNLDLNVQLTRQPDGGWIGVRAEARWTRSGVGRGGGTLFDRHGEIGAVSMGVVLTPFAVPGA
ncbi:MAG: thioesterase family protein [Chloroflexi bacterium]|nr:thioesterase family protein [Chloroflexota bacterium]MDA1147241.1 thioesterase family protein [Chloroflexota bacterium]